MSAGRAEVDKVASGAEGANRGAQLPARGEKKNHRSVVRNHSSATPREIELKVASAPERQIEPRERADARNESDTNEDQ